MLATLRGEQVAVPRVSFLTYELMWRTLTPKRWQLLGAMMGQGPMSIREAARRVGRDVKAVHGDVRALSSFIKKTDDGRIVFPYNDVHVDFLLSPKTETIAEFVAANEARRRAKKAAA